ncbi:MAG: TonB family protein [Bacteroidales bacterium]|nr:TonB family protein [Bacteroidales bacterium]
MRKTLVVLALLCLTVAGAKAQEQTYNFQRAMELYNNGQFADAAEYLDKEIKDNPKNAGYCYAYLSNMYLQSEMYSDALSYATKAISTVPKKDKTMLAGAYGCRAFSYLSLKDTVNAVSDFEKALKQNKEYTPSYQWLGNIYRDKGDYKMAEENFKKIVAIDKTDAIGYYGLAGVYFQQERYNEALEQYSYALKLKPEASNIYVFRANTYLKLNKYNEAVDDLITALDLDGNDYAFRLMTTLDSEPFQIMKTRLKIKSNKEPNQAYWPYVIGAMFQSVNNYQQAIEYYTKAYQIDNSLSFYKRIATCYMELGNYSKALQCIDEVIEADTLDMGAVMTKANILNEMERTKEAIKTLDRYIAADPENYWGYYRRGWFKEEIKDIDGAIEDYTTAIILEPNYVYSYASRGKMYLDKGMKDLAEKDFKKTIELDSIPEDNSCAMYAYFYLGQTNKAKEFMDSVMAHSDDSSYYDAACLYSIMGEKQKAVNYLENALRKGYRRFAHIERDRDLDNIRNMQEFKDLIKKYKAIAEEENTEEDSEISEYIEKTTEVPFTREVKIFKVKCKINDLPLNLIFDTGASDVSLSMVEATFMYKNGYINDKDIIGTQYFKDANGNINEGTVINLRSVSLEDVTLNNIRASVVKNQKAPLLLGQSVLEKFGKIEIDNENKVLKITRKTEQESSNLIFDKVDEQAEFPGGLNALINFLSQNIKYPQKARETGTQGKVFLTFVVEKDGSITDIKVLRDIGSGCGEEAVRVVKLMPKWEPAKKDGKYVRQQFNLPVNFSLNNDN